MITNKIPAEMPIDALCKIVSKIDDKVRLKGRNTLVLNYSDTKILVLKKKKGYDVSPDVPIAWLWIMAILLFVIQIIIKNPFGNGVDYIVSAFTGYAITSLVFAVIIYWVCAEIYVASKKKLLNEFVDSLRLNEVDINENKITNSKDEKRERLSKMMDEMEKENKEKFYEEGDQQAGQKLADLAYFREQMESSCEHVWSMDSSNGRYYCSKCGADGGSPWDC